MLSCTKPNIGVIRLLIQSGANMRLVNKDGWNCFHIAAREGQTEILTYLLDCCTDIWDSCSKNGRTPLHTAGTLYYACRGCLIPRGLLRISSDVDDRRIFGV